MTAPKDDRAQCQAIALTTHKQCKRLAKIEGKWCSDHVGHASQETQDKRLEKVRNYYYKENPTIDWRQVDLLCQMHATQEEICAFIQCHPDTINSHCKKEYGITFSEYSKERTKVGKTKLRQMAMKSASKGSTAMQIFLLKNQVGYADKVESKAEVTASQKVSIYIPDNERDK